MSKFFLVLALSLSTLTLSAAEMAEPRAIGVTQVAGGEIVRAATVRTATVKTQPQTSDVTAAASEQPSRQVSWEMVLAAVALMGAIALRRPGSPRQ